MSTETRSPFWTPWIDNTVPDAVNEIGVKFWIDHDMQRYAKQKDINDVQCLFAEAVDGYRSRLVVRCGKIIEESQSLEAVACFLDVLTLAAQKNE